MKVLFLYLSAYSTNGGIEKFNKAFMKAMAENEKIMEVKVLSSHDNNCDERYVSADRFKGFNEGKVLFSMEAVAEAGKFDKIILGHINLAPVGLLIKKLYPEKHIILIAHGIELWGQLSGIKKSFINNADRVFAVSNFTRTRLIEEQKTDPAKIKILCNTIDPFFEKPVNYTKPDYLIKRYGINEGNKVITTICRISSEEKYKGYDKVIEIFPEILKTVPEARYILVGKYDEKEKERISTQIKSLNLESNIILTGFIPEAELADHYRLADLFVMPSKGEGFGIVYLEAMACGVPVITGNNDGSKEIVEKLGIGKSLDPENKKELSETIIKMICDEEPDKNYISRKVEEVYGFESYKSKVSELIL